MDRPPVESDERRITTMKSPRVILALICTLGVSLALLAFLPALFIVTDVSQSRVPNTMDGLPVVRYGVSRLSNFAYEDGKQMSGKAYQGMCFVEFMQQGVLRRRSGAHLRVRTFYNAGIDRVERVEYSFD